ncbi:MAG: YneF family protein [Bacilli bacterium]|nr:YneF family protein [Bacilli bacterium]
MEWSGSWFALVIAGLVIGLIAGFFLSRWFFKRELKKNPPINEKMIRAMFMSMGRKPSEAQVRQVMKSMQNNQ